jgi:hypothetical protein
VIPKVAGSIPVSHPRYEKAVSALAEAAFSFTPMRKRPPDCYAIMMAQATAMI